VSAPIANPAGVPAAQGNPLQAVIEDAIVRHELGKASPYALSFALLGGSGASFGRFQGDTAKSPLARATLAAILSRNHVDGADSDRILALLERPCPHGDPLAPDDSKLVADALDSVAGQAAVDAMDAQLLQQVLAELQTSIDAGVAAARPCADIAQLYIAMWINMTGAPDTLNRWIRGAAFNGVASPTGAIGEAEISTYLHATRFFTQYPSNFPNMQQSARAAMAARATN